MELREAAQNMRNWLEIHGLPYVNLIFYGLPKPLGFAYRSTIALSIPLVKLNPWGTFADVALHEMAHIIEDGHGHDEQWAWRAQWLGSFQERTYTPEFDRMWHAWEANKELQRAGDRFLERVCDVLDRRAQIWIPGHIDYTSFSKPPNINDEDQYTWRKNYLETEN